MCVIKGPLYRVVHDNHAYTTHDYTIKNEVGFPSKQGNFLINNMTERFGDGKIWLRENEKSAFFVARAVCEKKKGGLSFFEPVILQSDIFPLSH